MLPPAETPAHTEGREGFYHLTEMRGDEETATLRYIIRDHDTRKIRTRARAYIRRVADVSQRTNTARARSRPP